MLSALRYALLGFLGLLLIGLVVALIYLGRHPRPAPTGGGFRARYVRTRRSGEKAAIVFLGVPVYVILLFTVGDPRVLREPAALIGAVVGVVVIGWVLWALVALPVTWLSMRRNPPKVDAHSRENPGSE